VPDPSEIAHERRGDPGVDAGSWPSAPAHLAEIAEILAVGVMRLRARKSSGLSAYPGESSLDFTPDQSGHAKGLPMEIDA
jgi:hypothetical protein